jgi:hypothetical protein
LRNICFLHALTLVYKVRVKTEGVWKEFQAETDGLFEGIAKEEFGWRFFLLVFSFGVPYFLF